MEEYDIEPFMPAVSPGAPVPSPKYVPFDYGKMTPGNYYSHDLGFRGSKVAPGTLDNVYNSGLNVKIQGAKNKWFRPTAWNNSVSQSQLGGYGNNQKLMQRIGADSVAYKNAGRNARAAAHTKTTVLPQGTRSTSSKSPMVIYKGPKDMFYKPGPDFIKSNVKPSTGGFSEFSGNLRPKRIPSGSINPKRIVGHFPAGSTEMMTKPGMVTGKMPMFRGIGGGLIDMFMEGPELQKAKTDPLYGVGDDERAQIDAAYQYGL